MKIAFYVPNGGLKNINFSHPANGNPGTGAAEYLHVALPYYISDKNFDVYIYAQSIIGMPSSIPCVACDSIRDAAIKAKKNGIDIFVFRPRIEEEDHILDLLDELKLNSIGRAALTPSISHQYKMSHSSHFKALVAVGSEQYDFLCDSPVSQKLTYIDNGVSIQACRSFGGAEKNMKLVTYMGALVPQKGFHILARVWPDVIKIHPDAQLRVIGSSRIYNENYTVGPLGVADVAYEENYLIPYLCDPSGKLHTSVKFLGPLGSDKYWHLAESLVGVANPSGQTETCCVSAIEMAACSAAVVSGAYYALLGTVRHGVSGLLGRGDKNLVKNICYLLSNPAIAIQMGERGAKHAEEKYDFSKVAVAWKMLFINIHEKKKIFQPKHEFNYLRYHRKYLRLLNFIPARFLRKVTYWPSIQEVENILLSFIRRINR